MVDWSRIVLDLRFNAKLSVRKIGNKVGLSCGQISRITNGSEPLHSNGERIIALWEKQMNKTRNDIPTI